MKGSTGNRTILESEIDATKLCSMSFGRSFDPASDWFYNQPPHWLMMILSNENLSQEICEGSFPVIVETDSHRALERWRKGQFCLTVLTALDTSSSNRWDSKAVYSVTRWYMHSVQSRHIAYAMGKQDADPVRIWFWWYRTIGYGKVDLLETI